MPKWQLHPSFTLCGCYVSLSNSCVICPIRLTGPLWCTNFDTNLFYFCHSPHRKPCLQVSSFGTAAQQPLKGNPIHPKLKRHRKLQNVFLDDRGFPDQSNEYNHLLHSIDGGPVLRKLRLPMPDHNGPIDPSFDHPFIKEEHEEIMRKKVDLSHLDPYQQN